MPFEWAVVFVVFVVVCTIASAVLRRDSSSRDLNQKSPAGSEREPQAPSTPAGPSPLPTDFVQAVAPTRETNGEDDWLSSTDEADGPQVRSHKDFQPIGSGTAAPVTKEIDLAGTEEGADGKSDFPGQEPASLDEVVDGMMARLHDEDPETVVYGLDPSNESDDNRRWSPTEQRRLLHCYSDNEDWDIVDLARHFGTTSRSVVITLVFLLLEPEGPVEDRRCPRWRQPWTQRAVDDVHDLFRAGASLPEIARASGRDQLSVAFRLFRDRLPEVHGVTDDFLTM